MSAHRVGNNTKNEIPHQRVFSTPQDANTHQNSANSTVKIITSDLLRNADDIEVDGDGTPAIQNENNRYHLARIEEEITLEVPIAHGCQPTASILQSKSTDSLNPPSVRRNEVSTSGPKFTPSLMENSSTTHKEQRCKLRVLAKQKAIHSLEYALPNHHAEKHVSARHLLMENVAKSSEGALAISHVYLMRR
ncbi:uncharacterized protein [Nicotiana tomentosiformis]|uniref:uncharacterized protein n=1 Tax=Nicotiana tomentosiformis TaxID=4098 RepID=UPI00388C8768